MLRALLTLMLTICLALPALAMPVQREVGQPQTAMASHCDKGGAMPGKPIDHSPQLHKGCIGCIPPIAGNAASQIAQLAPISPEPLPLSRLSGTRIQPATPPPKS
jgi:hypothetical protein